MQTYLMWGGGENAPAEYESLKVELVSTDQIYTSATIDDIKSILIVEGVIGEQLIEVASNDYSLEFEGPFLVSGDNTVTVSYGKLTETVTLPSVQLDQILTIEADDSNLGTIYTTVTEEQLKNGLSVKAHFNSGIELILNPEQYSVSWMMADWSDNNTDLTFTVRVDYNGYIRVDTFNHSLNPLQIIGGFNAESTSSIPSNTTNDDLISGNFFNVSANFNDGVTRSLPYTNTSSGELFEYSVSGSVLSGQNTSDFTTTLTVFYIDNPSFHDDVSVTVDPVEPTGLTAMYTSSNRNYEAYSQIDRDELIVILDYGDAGSITLQPNQYDIRYEGSDGAIDETSFRVPSDGGRASIEVYLTEYGTSFEAIVTGFNVSISTIDKPYMDEDLAQDYDGSEKRWRIYGFDNERMSCTVNGGEIRTDENGYTNFYATGAGTYTITVSLIDPNSITWSDGTTVGVVMYVTIIGANLNLSITVGDAEYDPQLELNVSVTGVDLNGETFQIPTNDVEFSYSGTTASGSIISGTDLPDQAGTWTVYATVNDFENYRGDTAQSNPFIISKHELDVPELSDPYYDGTEKTPELATSSNLFYVSGTGAANAGTYYATVTINADYRNNYCWDETNPNGYVLENVPWSLLTANNNVVSSTINGWTYSDNDSVDMDAILNQSIQVTTTFDTRYTVELYLDSAFMNLATRANGQYDAGDYWVRLVFAPDSDKDENGVLNFNGFTVDFEKSITVSPFEIPFISNAGSKSYVYDHDNERSMPQSSDMIDTKYYSVVANHEFSEAGTHNNAVQLKLKQNFVWNSSQEVQRDGTIWLSFTIKSVNDNLVSILWDEPEGDLVYGSTNLSFPETESRYGPVIVYFWTDEDSTKCEWNDDNYPKDAGTYHFQAVVLASAYNSYNGAESETLNFEILPKSISDVPKYIGDIVYNGEEQTLIISASTFSNWNADIYTIDDKSKLEATNHSVSGYDVYVGLSSNYKWDESVDGVSADNLVNVKWNINKRPITLSTDLDGRTIVISTGINHPSYAVVDSSGNAVAVNVDPTWSSQSHDANSYHTGSLKIIGGDFNNNYWIVNHENNGSTTDERMMDSVDETGQVLTIWYTFVLDSYEITVEIDLKDEYVYDGEEFATPSYKISLVDDVSITDEEASIITSYFDDVQIYYTEEGSAGSVTPIDVGTYTIHFVIPAFGDYGYVSWSESFDITEATIDANLKSSYECDYSGEDVLDPLGEKLKGSLNIYERDQSEIRWSFSNFPSGSNGFELIDVALFNGEPAPTTVWYTVSAGGNYKPISGSFTVTVNPVTLTVVLNDDVELSKTYDGTAPDLTGFGYTACYNDVPSDIRVTFSLDSEVAVNATEYPIIGDVDSDNFNAVEVKIKGSDNGLQEAIYTIRKATLIDGNDGIPENGAYITYQIDTSPYDGSERSYTWSIAGNPDKNNIFTVTVTIDGSEGPVKNADRYEYSISVVSSYGEAGNDGNYNLFEKTGEFTIPKREITFEFKDSVEIYYGEEIPSDNISKYVQLSSGFSFADGEDKTSFGYSLQLTSDDYQVMDDVNTYSLNQVWMLNEGAPNNYEIGVTAGSLSVIQRPITVTFVEGYNSSPYGLTADEINNRINSVSAFTVAPGVEGLQAFAEGHGPDDVFSMSIVMESDSPNVPDFDDYAIAVHSNPNYAVTLTATEEDGRAMYHVYAATLSAGLDLTGMKPIYDGQPKNVRVTFYNSSDEEIVAPVKYHIEYRFNSGEDWFNLDQKSIIDAGSYSVRVIVEETSNYVVSLTQGSFNISPANFERYDLTVGDAPEYDGGPKAMSVTGGTAYGFDEQFELTSFDITYYSNSDRTIELAPNQVVNAGTYYVTISVDSPSDNYLDIVDYRTFIVDQKGISPQIHEIYYDGETHNLDDLVIFTDPVKYSVTVSSGTAVGATAVTNAGEYTVSVVLSDESSNYIVEGSKSFTVEIKAIPVTVTLETNDDYAFGQLTRGNLSQVSTGYDVVVNSQDYNGGLDADAIKALFDKETSKSFRQTITAFTDIGSYVRAGTYNNAIDLSYNGVNFVVASEPADMVVSKAVLDVTIPNMSVLYDPSGMSFDSRINYTGTDYDQDVEVRLVLENNTTLSHVGTYALTAVVNDSTNFGLNIIAEMPGESDGVEAPYLVVGKAQNFWTDVAAGIGDIDYKNSLTGQDLTIDWPVPQNGVVNVDIYNSNNQRVAQFTNLSASGMSLNLPVGEYNVVFTASAVADDTGYINYGDISETSMGGQIYLPIESDFEVRQFALNVSWSPDYFQYEDGEVHRTVLTGLENYPDATVYIGDIDSDFPHTVDEYGQIVMSASDLGTYGIYLTLDNPNYRWEGSEGTTITVTWTIGHGEANSWETQPSISNTWQYGEDPEVLILGDASYGDVTTLFYNRSSETLYGEDGTVIPTLPGQYYMRSFVVEADGTIQLDEWLEFSITKRTLPVPDVSDNLVFAYESGETIRFNTDLIANYSVLEPYTLLAGNEANEPGNYTLAISIADTTCCEWEGGDISPKFIQWTVAEGGILDKTMFVVDISEEVFTGHPIQKSIVSTNLVEGVDYIVSYTDNDSAGLATIVITGIGAYSGQVTYEFQINPANEQPDFYNEQLKMYVEDSSFYNALQLPSYIDESLLTYTSSDPSIATVDPHTGAITMNATGTVTITASYPGTTNYAAGSATYELTVSNTPVEVVDHVVYIRVPVTDPDDPDDPIDDKPEEPTIVYQNDNTLYIILLLVLAVICVCFAAYIMYTHRKQDQRGGSQ